MKRAVILIAIIVVASAQARQFNIAVWRGETLATLIPDNIETGAIPEGLAIRTGVLRPVKYRFPVKTLQLSECYDLVQWGASGAPRMAEITVPADAKPGAYAWGDVLIDVVDRVLPPANEWKYYLDLWQHPWAVARVTGATPFSKAHFDAMRPVWELLATAGQKTLTTTLVDRPWNHQCRDAYGSMIGRVKKDDGSWKFDYALFDKYVEFGKSCGLGPHISCYTMCPWGYIVSWLDERGVEHKAEARPGTKVFEDFWGDFLADFARHLKEKGWFEDAYIAMDERSPEDVRIIAGFVQARAPGLKIAMAGNRKPSEFAGISIDSYSQVLYDVNPGFLAEVPARRAAGCVTTYYVCCSPAKPNTFIESWPSENFWVGVYPAVCGLDGLLRWAWNSWPEDPVQDAAFGNWRAGDTFLVYPGGAPSYRFLELRNGIVAAEKLRILREKGLLKDDVAALLKRFNLKDALDGKANFDLLKKASLEVVNRH